MTQLPSASFTTDGTRRMAGNAPARPFGSHHRIGVRIRGWLMTGLLAGWVLGTAWAVEPTESREWTAKTGHKLAAKALRIQGGKVQFERADGTKVEVPLDKLSDGDQETLRKHFDDGLGTDSDKPAAVPAGEAADDLPYPPGAVTDEISCGGDFHCFLYLPKSLRKGAKHPVVFVMNPGGGGKGTVDRYQAGAERNRWIVAVSKESKNNFDGSQNAVDAMIKHVTSNLPIDGKRMYASGFSGGSRMAFATVQKHREFAGVIACGAGGGLGGSKQVAYGLCGANCFNRTDMANSFRGFKSKDGVLRYFTGRHVWADAELCDDAMTHLNGVFLIANRAAYPADCAFYLEQVGALIAESAEAAPLRAFMWTSFLTERKIKDPKVAGIHETLAKSATNKLYVKGLAGVSEFAQKEFGNVAASQWQADPKVAAACKREAAKYAGTPWETILTEMAEDAEKF